MDNIAYVSMSHQSALRKQLDLVAQNIANMNTTSFKSQSIVFSEYVHEINGTDEVSFVQDVASFPDLSEGTLRGTGNTLDLAIHKDGYFRIDTPDQVSYTRNGHFQLDEEGILVTSGGHALLSDDGQPLVTFPGDSEIEVAEDGTVSSESGIIGRIDVVDFENPYLLEHKEATLFTTSQEPIPATGYVVRQGMLEDSNVEPIIEMTRMIELVRSYQSSKSLIDDHHELARRTISTLAKAPE